MSIPDYISPIVGYRVWTWGTTGLKSLCGERWKPSQSLAARCRASTIVGRADVVHDVRDIPQANCTCGIYAVKTLHHFRSAGYERYGIHGEVYLWGTVVEHEFGWRSQFAYPKVLFLPPDLIPSDTKEMEVRLKTLAEYGADVFILGGGRKIPLCRRDSGFDAGGLDYLIGKRTEYYARRQRDRTLMRGDRVAILGRGIAVVEHVDSKWIRAAVLGKIALRIARKHIRWDDQNMRWETSPHACAETKGKA